MMMMMMMMMQKKTTKMMMMMMMTSMGTTTRVGRDDVASSSRDDCFGLLGKHPHHHRRKKGAFFAKKRASSSSRHHLSLFVSFRFVSFRFVRERERKRKSCFFVCVCTLLSKGKCCCFGDELLLETTLFEHIMERESVVLNSFRLQYFIHFSFFISLSLSLVVCNTNTQLFFVLLGRWNLFFFYNFLYGTLTLCPFSFFLSLLCFPKFSLLVVGSNTHRKQTFGLHNVVIALFEEEKRHNSFEFYYTHTHTHTHTYIYIYISRKEAR